MIKKRISGLFNSNYSNLFGLIIIFIVLALTTPTFLTPRNITNLTMQIAVVGILAVGMTLVILIKEIDLSVARVAALCGVIAALLQVNYQQGATVTIAVCLVVGALLGLWNGALIAYFKIPSFIITLGTMSIANGLAFLLTGSKSIGPTQSNFAAIGNGYIDPTTSAVILAATFLSYLVGLIYYHRKRRAKGLPSNLTSETYLKALFIIIISGFFAYMFTYHGMPYSVVILLVIALVAWFILNKMSFGRHLYAIGGNEKAAYLAGINVRLDRLMVFGLMGMLAAIAGVVLTARLDSATPAMAQMYELDAIAAVVIGGTSLSGGLGTIGGSIIGIFIIGMLNNGMSLLNIDIYWQWVFKGLIIIGAVLLDRRNKNN